MPRANAAVTWLPHATALLELDGMRLLTDPVIRDRIGPLVRVGPPPTKETLERVDIVMLSHLHADHADPSITAGSRQLNPDSGVGRGRRMASAPGLRDVRELAPGEEVRAGRLRIRATPASHDGRRFPLGPRVQSVGYVVESSCTTYFAGDTDLFDAMTQMRGSVEVALLPVWGWGRGRAWPP